MIKKSTFFALFALLIPALTLCMDPLLFTKKRTNWILVKQRYDMKKRLLKNEEDTALALLQKFNFSSEEAQSVLTKAEKAHQDHLAYLKNDCPENSSTGSSYYDPSCSIDPNLPKEWVDAIQHECNRHNININKLNLIIARQSFTGVAYAQIYTVGLNLKKIAITSDSFSMAAVHEMVHITQGHIKKEEIIFAAIRKKNPYISDEMIDNTYEFKKYSAAREKTADTLIACNDPIYTLQYKRTPSIYIQNHADIEHLRYNWILDGLLPKNQNN